MALTQETESGHLKVKVRPTGDHADGREQAVSESANVGLPSGCQTVWSTPCSIAEAPSSVVCPDGCK